MDSEEKIQSVLNTLDGRVVKSIQNTCSACPSQWEGITNNGLRVYVRYRWGGLSVDIGTEEVFFEQFGDSLDGFLTYEELKEATKGLIEWPEEEG